MGTIANVRVGKPDTKPNAPSHTKGVREGNEGRGPRREDGHEVGAKGVLRATGRRSTGINAKDREPIDPRSPRLTPA
jgi:hypothetical protein